MCDSLTAWGHEVATCSEGKGGSIYLNSPHLGLSSMGLLALHRHLLLDPYWLRLQDLCMPRLQDLCMHRRLGLCMHRRLAPNTLRHLDPCMRLHQDLCMHLHQDPCKAHRLDLCSKARQGQRNPRSSRKHLPTKVER